MAAGHQRRWPVLYWSCNPRHNCRQSERFSCAGSFKSHRSNHSCCFRAELRLANTTEPVGLYNLISGRAICTAAAAPVTKIPNAPNLSAGTAGTPKRDGTNLQKRLFAAKVLDGHTSSPETGKMFNRRQIAGPVHTSPELVYGFITAPSGTSPSST